ncbi:MAG: leucine-rich repeat domain-containing protein, partial [Oscillospiraceae bacterium]|nr:leucine-rich repeat domain-containing protein [Oscillospiraceae bacterium]
MKISKITVAAMALLIAGGVLPTAEMYAPVSTVSAVEEVPYTYAVDGDLRFKVYNGYAILDGFSTEPSGEFTVPSEINGVPVTSLSENLFKYKNFTKVNLPDSITFIPKRAFYYSSISEITIPDSVTVIGPEAFAGCKELTEVIIPDSVTEIGASAFAHCG